MALSMWGVAEGSRDSLPMLLGVFPHLTPAACMLRSDWFISLFEPVVIGWSNCIGFGHINVNEECSRVKLQWNSFLKRYLSVCVNCFWHCASFTKHLVARRVHLSCLYILYASYRRGSARSNSPRQLAKEREISSWYAIRFNRSNKFFLIW